MKTLEKDIRGFITENFLFGEAFTLSNDDSLLEEGIIDSTGVIELMMFLETTYGIAILDHEVTTANLDSVNKLIGFIGQKITGRVPLLS